MNARATPPELVVLGSLNMDLVAQAERLPAAGETVAARTLLTLPGGKGANQALAAARGGAAVWATTLLAPACAPVCRPTA